MPGSLILKLIVPHVFLKPSLAVLFCFLRIFHANNRSDEEKWCI